MTDDFPDVRIALDAVPIPATAPVNLASIYRAAHELQIRAARRWKRASATLAALTAGVIAVALIPKLDVRLTGDEFAVRWGQASAPMVETKPEPAVIAPQVDPRLPSLIDGHQQQIAVLRATNSKLTDVQELLLALTTDVADRDTAQLARIAQLARELRAFQLATAQQFDQTEKTNTTLYNAVFDAKPKPGE